MCANFNNAERNPTDLIFANFSNKLVEPAEKVFQRKLSNN